MNTVDVERRDWYVLTTTQGGKVSLLRHLTLKEAVMTHERLNPFYGMPSGSSIMGYPGMIDKREIIGPEGWDGCHNGPHHVWPVGEQILCDGGPNKGRHYTSVNCANCRQNKFEWSDGKGYKDLDEQC